MDNAWLIRPYPHKQPRLSEFLDNEIIAVGWPCIGDLNGKSREELKETLSEPPYSYEGLTLGNAYATIDIFVNQMKAGDLLLMPNGDDIYFGKISSDYYFDPSVDNDKDGYPHQRKAKWLKNTSRKELSKDLRLSLKVHRTAANLSHHFAEIDALIHDKEVPVATPASTDTIDVSYPLRPNYNVSFSIPIDITADEAKRLSAYFASLYFKD